MKRMKNDISLTTRKKHVLLLNIFIFETHSLPERWSDSPERTKGEETQELGSQGLGGRWGGMQGGPPGLLPGQRDPPQKLAQTDEQHLLVGSHLVALLGVIRWEGEGKVKGKGEGRLSFRTISKWEMLCKSLLGI